MSFSVANHQHDSTSKSLSKKLWCTIQNQDQGHQRPRSCPCQLRRCTVFCSIRTNMAEEEVGKVRRRPRQWHVQGRFRLIYHLLLLLCPSSIACTLSGSNDQCDGNECCPSVRGSRHRPFSCHQADACASLLLLVTVHLAAVPSPPGVEPAP